MLKLNQEKTTLFFFLVFLLIAALLRFYSISKKDGLRCALDKDGLRYDELHSIIPTHPDERLFDVIEYSKGDQPPLFFVMLHGWFQFFPYNEASGKTLCVLLGLAGTVAMFFLGREIAGNTAGLASMFITALNVFHNFYSLELRFYSLLFLLTTLSFWAFIRFLRSPSILNQCAFILISTSLLYTHYFALVVVVTQAVIFLAIAIFEKRPRSFLLKGFIAAFATIILFSPWLPVIFGDLQISSFWIPETDINFFTETFTRYFQGWWGLSFKWVLTTVLLVLMVFFIYQIFSVDRTSSEKTNSLIVVTWLVLTLLIPVLYSLLRVPVLLDRYTMITLPAVILTIAIGWSWIKSMPVKVIIAITFVLCIIRVMNGYYKTPLIPQYREIVQEVITDNKSHLPVFSLQAWHLNYYIRKYKVPYNVQPLTTQIVESVDTVSGFYVIFPEFISDADKERLSKSFDVKKQFSFFHADAVYYEKKAPNVKTF